jgi:hypothetical protein
MKTASEDNRHPSPHSNRICPKCESKLLPFILDRSDERNIYFLFIFCVEYTEY